jgi:hypothetical protein
MSRDTLTYECDCGAEIDCPNGGAAYKLGYHVREQCPDPPAWATWVESDGDRQ